MASNEKGRRWWQWSWRSGHGGGVRLVERNVFIKNHEYSKKIIILTYPFYNKIFMKSYKIIHTRYVQYYLWKVAREWIIIIYVEFDDWYFLE